MAAAQEPRSGLFSAGDFRTYNPKLWLQPEVEELRTAFSKLRKLFVCGIFVEFDILWTTALLVAAPSIEMLHIEVWEHTCDVGEARPASYHDRRNPRWEMHLDSSSENRLLKELEFAGFKSLEQQFTFIRYMLEQSPNLQKIVLRDEEQCDDCDALKVPRPSRFPRKEDEQEMVVKRIRDGMFSPEIIFYEHMTYLTTSTMNNLQVTLSSLEITNEARR
ncbi:uncharacterized protein [Aegilops tauschii subsp. strangulata]|uniref:uncharacterized protein isoform X4 n=1 Tax=Aegilops tauschii subsp. strangulata TaxID=200361 RepID=UPI001ABC32B7|nr:uncharacterized protein LOC109732869 isoform X3 [Aegilops tauschii subsp. strangulata]